MFICPSPFVNLSYTAIVENYNIRRRKKINSNQFENNALVLCPGVVVLRLVLFFCLARNFHTKRTLQDRKWGKTGQSDVQGAFVEGLRALFVAEFCIDFLIYIAPFAFAYYSICLQIWL